MSATEFQTFKTNSQNSYASRLSKVEGIDHAESLKNAAAQFSALVPNGFETDGQFFFTAKNTSSGESVGFL
jgi:hypothetical protein